ncbi:hypothetical protein SEVIR_7G128600v4 [Setaria viridis]|uniref:Solute carrier family 40 protein n=1 Tax=Setaria viridis TaxID=4556 RepID=A0A4U6TPU0_SETVI|nr:hypothetical protein SEVIR_7G128600v2 [Setaria viridis]
MILQSLCLGFLPLLDAVGGLVSTLHSSIALHSPSHGGQFIHGVGKNEETEAPKSNHAVVDSDPLDLWHLWTVDLLDTSHVHVDLVFPCACNVASARRSQRSRTKLQRRKGSVFGGGSSRRDGGSFRRLVARHEQHLTCAVVVAALQVFLHLTRANATTLFLPLLSQATGSGRGAARVGDAVLVLVNTCGVLGSALAARELGRARGGVVRGGVRRVGRVQLGVGRSGPCRARASGPWGRRRGRRSASRRCSASCSRCASSSTPPSPTTPSGSGPDPDRTRDPPRAATAMPDVRVHAALVR